MIILIAGDTHTGKTLLAQKLLEKYQYPYLSIDHLKMGLIRSGQCSLDTESLDSELTSYLWPIIREMVKTCIENSQNLIIEGCYIPFRWENDFKTEYLKHIKYVCLIFSNEYIKNNLSEIAKHESIIEQRKLTQLNVEKMQETNLYNLYMCKLLHYKYILINYKYEIEIESL